MAAAKKYRILGWVIFVIYLMALFKLTVFRDDFLYWPLFTHGKLNYLPFYNLVKFAAQQRYYTILYFYGGNIAWFIPFGYFLPYLLGRPRKLSHIALYGFLLSLLIEVSQYIFGTGETEVDDLITNTLGAVVGFQLLKAYIRWRGKRAGLIIGKNGREHEHSSRH